MGVSYNFGFVIPSFVYETAEAKSSIPAGLSVESSAWQIGARFPMGAFTPFVSFGDGEIETRVPGFVSTTDTRSWQIGTTYNLSTRTWVYAAIGEGRMSGVDGGVSWRDKEEGYSIGLVHTF
ncbi:MAG: hypothetical protein B7Z09_10745 [Brevundimonas diminuta]|nr:MAG: hypothetical protein B7Z09_10745 [Brevundimonas diminuta]